MKDEKEIYNSMYRKLVKSEGMERSEEIVNSFKFIVEQADPMVNTFVNFQMEVINRYMDSYQELLYEYNKLWYNFLFIGGVALFLLGMNVYHFVKKILHSGIFQ